MVPSPAPTPRAMDFRPASMSPVAPPPPWASSVANTVRSTVSSLVMVGGGPAEVDGGQRREDEGLQRRHQADLEEEEGDGDRQRDDAEGGQPEDDGEIGRAHD